MIDTPWSESADLAVLIGTGDSRAPTGVGKWATSNWSAPGSTWSGVEPEWNDITCEAQAVHLARGVAYSVDRFPVSECQIEASNVSGWATQLVPNLLDVRPGRAVRIIGGAGGGTAQWSGYVDAITPAYDADALPTVRLDNVDGLAQLAGWDGLEVAPVGGGELSGARIRRLLDMIGWPATWQQIDPGQVNLQATNLARNLGDEAGVTADSEGGAVYADRWGNIVFRDRDWLRTNTGPPPLTIGNVAGADACPTGWEVTYDTGDIVSIVSLANAGDTVRRYIDGTALSLFGAATYQRYDLICNDAGQLDVLAGRILSVKARAGARIRAVHLSMLADPRVGNLIDFVDYGTRVRAVLVDQTGTQLDELMIVLGVEMDITPTDWTVRLALESAAPYAPAQPWGTARWSSGTWGVAA